MVRIDHSLLTDPERLTSTIDDLHRAWVSRTAVVIELAVDPSALSSPESTTEPPWELGALFTFPLERLRFLVWVNAYNALDGTPTWRWAEQAIALGAEPGATTDIVLPDGTPAWTDGGPRGPVSVPEAVVSWETIDLGGLATGRRPDGSIDAGLAADQAAAAHHGSGPARVVAPAGSGKTRTLAARLRHLEAGGYEGALLTAVAYNTRAANELVERLGPGTKATVRTIHSLGRAILAEARGEPLVLEERDMRQMIDRLAPVQHRPNTDAIGPYLEALGEVRIAFRDPARVEAERDDVPGFVEVFEQVMGRLDRRNEADFDHMVFGSIQALLADPALRRTWQRRCRHLLVDEFQDLTPAYLLLLRLLSSPSLDVFGVGDDDQVIYGYAGADPGYLITYDELFPGAADHPLTTNHRSPLAVVDAAVTLLTHNRRRVTKEIHPGPTARQGEDTLRVNALRGDRLAVAAAEQVETWIGEGRDPGSIAILARVNSALLPVHAALGSAGVAFSSTLDPTVLRRSVTSAALAWIRLALMPDDLETRDLIAAVTRPSRGLNRVARTLLRARRYGGVDAVRDLGLELEGRQATKWDGFCDDLESAVQAGASSDVSRILDVVLDSVGLAGSAALFDGKRSRADRSSHSDDLDALRRAAAIHPDATTFEPWLREQLAATQDPKGVLLTTIHRVKGLEWDRVIVYGADRRLMPHFLSGDVEEERRIFHVALTRGREEVVVLADEAKPSPFLAEMREAARPEDIAPAAPRGADRSTLPEVGARVRISGGLEGVVAEHDEASARVRLETGATIKVEAAELTLLGSAAAGDADPGLADLLRSWRLETSRANGVPAYVVFTDRSLEEIAARKPVTLADLSVVHGIGPAKLEQYGEDIIELVADFTAT